MAFLELEVRGVDFQWMIVLVGLPKIADILIRRVKNFDFKDF